MGDEVRPILTAAEMGRKRWADVPLEERRAWSKRANEKRWGKRRKRQPKVRT